MVIHGQRAQTEHSFNMKTYFISLLGMTMIFGISIQHIPMIINIVLQTIIGILTIYLLIKKIRSIKN